MVECGRIYPPPQTKWLFEESTGWRAIDFRSIVCQSFQECALGRCWWGQTYALVLWFSLIPCKLVVRHLSLLRVVKSDIKLTLRYVMHAWSLLMVVKEEWVRICSMMNTLSRWIGCRCVLLSFILMSFFLNGWRDCWASNYLFSSCCAGIFEDGED